MADFIPGQDVFTQGAQIGQVFSQGVETEFVFGMGCQLLPKLPIKIWGLCATRVVTASGEKWFEFGFRLTADLLGDASIGWTDADGFFLIEPEWSRDLINWTGGKFVPAPVPVVTLPSGQKQYWSRAINPVDSSLKSGQLTLASGVSDGSGGVITGDVRNNPFTALTVVGAVVPLSGFPYTMPTDAARLTADLQAFYPGSQVIATSSTVWQITIPGVNMTAYTQTNKISWPQYFVADMYGTLNTPVNGVFFADSFVDPAGNSIETKGFARLKITHGNLYPNYFPSN